MSDFRGYVCWDPKDVPVIINTTAEAPSDAVFLATHLPAKLKRTSSGTLMDWQAYDEDSFLNDFLDDRPATFVPVIGASGTGKSHLIRWLASKIERTPKRHVVVVPKYHTNLRSVIELILSALESDRYDDIRDRLQEATGTLSVERARFELATTLEFLVGPRNPEHSELTSMQQYLTESLPYFIGDPLIRERLTRENEVIDRFVREALRGRDIQDKQAPYEFCIEDLLLDFENLDRIGLEGQRFYQQLSTRPNVQEATVVWLNTHLPAALRSLYGLKTNELRSLIYDLRRRLLDDGKELVLLIEDFAVLQAIQGELLDAILEDTFREGRQVLCTMRTALAVTSGYFDRLDTAQTRATFIVSLDISTADVEGGIGSDDLSSFYSRYLNAVRIGKEDLDSALKTVSRDSRGWLPNACDECAHRDTCHDGFGTSPDGFGLYPFNRLAVANTARTISREYFNPRQIMNDVLRFTLGEAAAALRDGTFPTEEFGRRFDLRRLPANDRQILEQQDPTNHERRERLLTVWGEVPPIKNLHEGIHDAFELPLLDSLKSAPEDVPSRSNQKTGPQERVEKVTKAASTTHEVPVAPSQPELVTLLDDWANNRPLVQTDAQRLRDLVYQLVSAHIDWEAEGLSQSYFKKSHWTPSAIDVEGWESRASVVRTHVRLSIPLSSKNRTNAAVALRGAVLAKHYGHWNFDDGKNHLLTLRTHLSAWSEVVLSQLRTTEVGGQQQDPVPALVETLFLGASLCATPGVDGDSLQGRVNALLRSPPNASSSLRGELWCRLHGTFAEHHKRLVDALLARVGLAKGTGQPRMIDLAQIVPVLERVQGRIEIGEDDAAVDDVRLAQKALADLPDVLEAERVAVRDDVQKVAAYLGSTVDTPAFLAKMRDAASEAQRAGAFRPANWLSRIERHFQTLEGLSVHRIVAEARNLTELENDGEALRRLARWDPKRLRQLLEILKDIDTFLTESERQVETQRRSFGAGTEEKAVQRLELEIAAGLEAIASAVDRMRRESILHE